MQKLAVLLSVSLTAALPQISAAAETAYPLYEKLRTYRCDNSFSLQFASNKNTKGCVFNDRASAAQIQVMDAEDYPLIWICSRSTFFSTMRGASNEFFCGWVMAASIVTASGASVPKSTLQEIARISTFADVRKLPENK